MATYIWVNIGSDNILLPDATKINQNNVDLESNVFCGIHLKAASQEMSINP